MSAPFLRPGHYGSVVGDDPALGYADAENVEAYGGVLIAESISSLAMARAIMAVLPAVEVCRALARMEWCAPTAQVALLAALAARVVRCADTGRPDGPLMLGRGPVFDRTWCERCSSITTFHNGACLDCAPRTEGSLCPYCRRSDCWVERSPNRMRCSSRNGSSSEVLKHEASPEASGARAALEWMLYTPAGRAERERSHVGTRPEKVEELPEHLL